MKLKIIFDKESVNSNCVGGWGVAYLIDDKILFDTAEKAEYLITNLKALAVDIVGIEKVVISHNHWDHRAGLTSLLELNKKIEVFACSDFIDEFGKELFGYNLKLVEAPLQIANNVYTSGCLSVNYKGSKIKEQALVLSGEKGISLVSGCSHPGVLALINRAKEIFPEKRFYSLVGGLHLMDEDERSINYIVDEVKGAGVENIIPGHCTGFNAVKVFQKVYQEHFFDLKIGQEIEL
ncbi:MAG: MBL fold metallo-hydrolase [Candidatus Omnitrophica bacterium]|nr:MBL fold metallo-hydrolase [Candidatus Omnitrophota bacterium]